MIGDGDHPGRIEPSDRLVDAGRTPCCIGIASAGRDDGWPATDALEAIVLRQHGPDVHGAWSNHRIPSATRWIVESARTMCELVFTPGYLAGGSALTVRTNWAEGPFALVEKPPGC